MPKPLRLILIPLITLTLGCVEDERLANMAQDATQRQAEQNHAMAQQNRELVEASKRLVEAHAQTRQEFINLNRDLQAQQAETARQHTALEAERRQIAQQRRWDSLLAATLTSMTVLLACLLPLVVAIYALWASREEAASDAELAELLTREMVAEQPVLLARHDIPALTDDQKRLQLAQASGPDGEQG